MNHIRFESAREVCFFPKLLGLETIIVDYSKEICKDCMAAVMNYNDRISNYELALSIPRKPIEIKKERKRYSTEEFAVLYILGFFLLGVLIGAVTL